MSAIDEGIVREFFEQNGFFVRQVRKYQVQARRKTGDEEIDLLVHNPTWEKASRKPDFFLFSTELPYVHQAVVAVKPWHTDVFTPAMLKGSPEIFGFLEQNVLKQAARLFPPRPTASATTSRRSWCCRRSRPQSPSAPRAWRCSRRAGSTASSRSARCSWT